MFKSNIVSALIALLNYDVVRIGNAIASWKGDRKLVEQSSDSTYKDRAKKGFIQENETISSSFTLERSIVGQFVAWDNELARLEKRSEKLNVALAPLT